MGEIGMMVFKTKVLDNIEDYLKEYEGFEDCHIEVESFMKENVQRLGLVVNNKSGNHAPIIYLDDYYRDFMNGKELDDVLRDMAEMAVNAYHSYPDFGDIKEIMSNPDNVICELINTKWNSHLIANIPHRNIEDLSLIYRIRVADDATFLITGKLLSEIGMNEKQLYEAAMRNSVYKIATMTEVLSELTGLEQEDLIGSELGMDMLVITSEDKKYGATAVLNKAVMDKAVDMLGTSDIVVLPSSIHEVIVLPDNEDVKTLAAMVREVNDTQVLDNERLSNNVYKYNKESGLRIATTDHTRNM